MFEGATPGSLPTPGTYQTKFLALFDRVGELQAASMDVFNVKAAAYGAVGDGVTNDATKIQAALNAAAVVGGIAFAPIGVFMVASTIVVPANVTLRGAGLGLTIIKAMAGCTANVVNMNGASDVTVEDLTIDGAGICATVLHIYRTTTANMATRHSVRRVTVQGGTGYNFRVSSPLTDFVLEDSLLEDGVGTLINPTVAGSQNIRIARNRMPGIQVYGSTYPWFTNVSVQDNVCSNGDNPIELFAIESVVVTGNRVKGPGLRGISTANCRNMVIDDNVVRNQANYAVEINGGERIRVTGNIAYNCKSLCTETGYDGGAAGQSAIDLTISDNMHIGTGLSASASVASILVYGAHGLTIERNVFRGLEYATMGAIQIGHAYATTDAVVRDNLHIIDTANSALLSIGQGIVTDSLVDGNVTKVSRNLVAGDDYARVMSATMGAGNSVGVVFRHNEVVFTGTVSAAPNAVGIGANYAAAGTMARSAFIGNRVTNGPTGFWADITSADLIWADNDARTCLTPLGTFNAAIVKGRTADGAPLRPPTITGSRGANAALTDLLTKLATLGIVVDSSSV